MLLSNAGILVRGERQRGADPLWRERVRNQQWKSTGIALVVFGCISAATFRLSGTF